MFIWWNDMRKHKTHWDYWQTGSSRRMFHHQIFHSIFLPLLDKSCFPSSSTLLNADVALWVSIWNEDRSWTIRCEEVEPHCIHLQCLTQMPWAPSLLRMLSWTYSIMSVCIGRSYCLSLCLLAMYFTNIVLLHRGFCYI